MTEADIDGRSPRDSAIAIILEEHRSLRDVVHTLQRLVEEIGKQHADADFQLIACMLYYIDSFPERCHHPKEDEFLFRLLRERTAGADALLDELQAQHVRSAQMMTHLQQLFVHYVGGAPEGPRQFADAVVAYAAFMSGHMEREESGVLPLAEKHLKPGDWQQINAAFRTNQDPLAGAYMQREFHKLKQRILTQLPGKFKSGAGN